MDKNLLQRAFDVAETQIPPKISEEILTKIVIECLKNYQKKINVGVQDSFSDLLDLFKQAISEIIFDHAATWRVATQRNAILFPANCRFLYTKGNKTIAVVEEKPQIRSLLLKESITNSPTRRFGLALPYTVFVVVFKDDKFGNLYAGWRNSPLQKLEDILYRPLLSNIHINLSVCTGEIALNKDDEIGKKVQDVISFFWNSQFNHDLSNLWNEKQNYHVNLTTAESWEHFSKLDSSFILNTNLLTGSSVINIINHCTMYELEPDETTLCHSLTNKIDECIVDLFKRVMNYFQRSKFEKYYPKDLQDELKSALQFASNEYSKSIKVLQEGLNELKIEVEQKNTYGWEKRSKFWNRNIT
jgi:hypothetical protein